MSETDGAGAAQQPAQQPGEEPAEDKVEERVSEEGLVPRDALVMDRILREMGVKEYNPKVVAQLLEFAHRYVVEVLQDAMDYRDHAGRAATGTLDLDDVRMATQARESFQFTGPLPREIMHRLAQQCNQEPLPPVIDRFGVRVPEDRYCLTAANYEVIPDMIAQSSSSSSGIGSAVASSSLQPGPQD